MTTQEHVDQNQADSCPPQTPIIAIDDFTKIDLRVGLIQSCERVPKSKKLLKLDVCLGETLGSRQIIAGIGQHYDPETLINRRVVVVANLKPAQLMGLESHGMILAGAAEDQASLSIVEPSSTLPLGSRIR